MSKDVNAVVAGLKARGITKFASVGWCWGACMAVQAAAADAGSFRATAFLHPSMFGREKELVGKLQCPLASFSTPGGKRLSHMTRHEGTNGVHAFRSEGQRPRVAPSSHHIWRST